MALHSQRTHLRVILGCLAIVMVAAGSASAESAALVGNEACLECHDDLGESYARSLHGWIGSVDSGTAPIGCESCHGPGSQHVDDQEPGSIWVPSADAGEADSAACVGCHDQGSFMDWGYSDHASSDLACTSCHSIHGGNEFEASLVMSQKDLCTSCHMDQSAAFELPSHHPLREGFMGCSDCHDPHAGGYTGVQVTGTSRDLCVQCHSQYHGPFIFEHSPVEEDCGICHEPHGAVANHLLTQNEPFLCLQCHQPHFHSGLMSYDGGFTPPAGIGGVNPDIADLTGVSQHDSFKQVMLTKCSQCHQAVHGTDLPSQSIPGQGRALVR